MNTKHYDELMGRDRRMLDTLRIMAMDVAPVRGAKLAAALMHRNQIISFGINQFRTHPLQARFGKNSEAIFLHAEIDSIRNALMHTTADTLTRATLFVVRVKKTESGPRGKWCAGSACPCEGCSRAIANFGIRRVIASTNQEKVFDVWE